MMNNSKRKHFVIFVGLFIFLSFTSIRSVYAIPLLQLDISNGIYNDATQTIVATGSNFELYALLNSTNEAALSAQYFLSVAVFPQVSAPLDAYFEFGGKTYYVNGTDMEWDTPDNAPPGVQNHGNLFPTYFIETPFKFDLLNTAQLYNSAEDRGGIKPYDGNGNPLYFAQYDVDTSGLGSAHVLHFDLYGYGKKFAPPSHDAESIPSSVPEPATLFLLGSGLVWMVGWKREKS